MGEERKNKGIFKIGVNICNILIYNNIYTHTHTHTHTHTFFLWHVCCHFSCIWLFVTPQTVAHQTPLSLGFSRQEYLSGWPCPALGDPPDSGIKALSLMSPVLVERSLTISATWPPLFCTLPYTYFLCICSWVISFHK